MNQQPSPETRAPETRAPEPRALADGKRRSFFTRIGLAAFVGGLASGAGLSAFAQGRPGGEEHRRPGDEEHRRRFMDHSMDPARMDQRIERMVRHMGVDIGATPEQTNKLVAIAKSAAADLRPLRMKAREARKQGIDLLAAPAIDRGAIERLRAEQIQAADGASRRLTQALADAAEVLTPEQRVKLKQHFEKRAGRRHGMHRWGR